MLKPDKSKIPGAIALGYNTDKDYAPKVLAKGKGELAEKIISIGKENEVYIKEEPQLFETLYKLDVGEEIPRKVYSIVAEILAFVYKMENKIKERF